MRKGIIPAIALGAALALPALACALPVPREAGAPSAAGDVPGAGTLVEAGDPRIAVSAVLASDGSPFALQGAWVHEGSLAVSDRGIKVVYTLREGSGLQPESARLELGRASIRPDEAAGGVLAFKLSLREAGSNTIDLSRVRLSARDTRGAPVVSDPLAKAAPFKGARIDSLMFVDDSADSARPAVTVVLDGKPMRSGDILCTRSASAFMGLQLTDPLFERLREDEWFTGHPIVYTVDGRRLVLDPSELGPAPSAGRDGFRTNTLLTWEEEGRHRIDVLYEGAVLAGAPADAAPLGSQAAAEVIIDRTAPLAASASVFGGYDQDAEVAPIAGASDGDPGYAVLFGGARTMEIALEDRPAHPGADVSGVSAFRLTVRRHARMDGSGIGAVQTFTERDLEIGESGIIKVPLSKPGTYLLSEMSITVRDRAGNESAPMSLQSVTGELPFDRVTVDDEDGFPASAGFGIEVSSSAGAVPGRAYHDDGVAVTFWGKGARFDLFRRTPAFRRAIQATFASWEGEQTLADSSNQPVFSENPRTGRVEATLGLPRDPDGGARDGRYRISFRGSYLSRPATADFLVDTTPPTVTDVRVEAPPDPARDIAVLEGPGRLAVGGPRTLKLRIQDLQPRDAGAPPARVAAADEDGTAGVDEKQLKAAVGRWLDLDAASVDHLSLIPSRDRSGWVEIPLAEEGVYPISDIDLTLPDRAGNGGASTTAASSVGSWDYDGILVDTDDTVPSVSIAVSDAPGTPAAKDKRYHRGRVDVSVTVEDRWFAAYRAMGGRQQDSSAMTMRPPGSSSAVALPALGFDAFEREPGTDTWVAPYALPPASEAPDALPQEGGYELGFTYRPFSGGGALAASASFGIDYTGPSFGALTLARVEPHQWGWIFATDEQRVAIAVEDNLSGVRASTGRLFAEGTAHPELTFSPGDSKTAGAFEFSLATDAERLVFAGTHVGVEDEAGNPADSGSFSERVGTDLPRGAVGICMDLAAPELEVSYDNNDVANGIYYKENRTATVSVVESNFDLIRRYDEDRSIAEVERDGTSSEVRAGEFANPSGDGRTWVATVPFDQDADWALSARIVDPAGRSASFDRDAFVIDTTAPLVTVSFDNNDVANGKYYKAPRAAEITVRERNFSVDLANVAPWARDAAGAAATAPGIAGWRTPDPRAEWSTTVSFGAELHYGMTVSVTDLAGNAGEVFEEPEFVIDLTAPEVEIAGVEEHTAYADGVRPSITYRDANFDALFTRYELAGSVRGPTRLPTSETAQAAGLTVAWDDFPHILENDDVYTLGAHIEDLAGNSSDATVRFSVNRFGSTYYFPTEEGDVSGRFLPSPRDVDIVEVNVSGLDVGATRVEVAHDTRVSALVPGRDFQVSQGSAGAWSATSYHFPKGLFAEDGYHRIMLTSRDRAGNLSQNGMPGKDAARERAFNVGFAVDTTAPEAALIGIDPHGVYLDPHKTALLDAHDNMELERVELAIDGDPSGTWSPQDLVASPPTVALPVDDGPHTYELTAIDRAGNRRVTRYDGVVVAGDWLGYIRNTPRLLFGSVGGGILMAAALGSTGYLVHRHRKRDRDLRERVNDG